LGLGMGGDVGSVDRADAPGAELTEADHARAFDYSPSRSSIEQGSLT